MLGDTLMTALYCPITGEVDAARLDYVLARVGIRGIAVPEGNPIASPPARSREEALIELVRSGEMKGLRRVAARGLDPNAVIPFSHPHFAGGRTIRRPMLMAAALYGPSTVRLLASRGFAVLQLNYRSSMGYGRAFMEAGTGALSGRLQQDVLDAARWAIAEGHAAEGRVALHGGSFGGLLALSTLARYPGAFRAGVAINPVTDAVTFWKREWPRDDARALWQKFLASRDLPVAALASVSPVNNVRNIDAPVLLVAGARDRRVPPEHSFELFNLLRAAGKPAELVEYRGSGHNIWSGNADTRKHVAGSIALFLDRHLAREPR